MSETGPELQQIAVGDSRYPHRLLKRLGSQAPECLYARGDLSPLRRPLLGLVCSIQCPGTVIIKVLDTVRDLRDRGIPLIAGFHSPMEQACLDILLRGPQPVVLVPARGIARMRLDSDRRSALAEGRLLLLSCFGPSASRPTKAYAAKRNSLVAALAEALWVPHAAPGGKTWTAVNGALQRRQPVYTFDVEDNRPLLDAGARPFEQFDFPGLESCQVG